MLRFGTPPYAPLAWWEIPFIPIVCFLAAGVLGLMFLLELASIPFRAAGMKMIEFNDRLDEDNVEPDQD